MRITLENEMGLEPREARGRIVLLGPLLTGLDPATYQLLSSLDSQGDTTIERSQIESFISEWRQLYKRVQTDEEIHLLAEVEMLALNIKRTPGLSLKFSL